MRQLDLLVAGRAEKVPGVQEPLGPPFGPPIASRLAPYRLGGSPGGRDAESTKASRVAPHQQGAFIKLTWQLGKPVRWVNRLDVPADCAESTFEVDVTRNDACQSIDQGRFADDLDYCRSQFLASVPIEL